MNRRPFGAKAVAAVETNPHPDGGATIGIDLIYPGFLMPVVYGLGLRRRKTFLLDPLAWECYRAMDGQRPLSSLIARFSETHRLSFHEARAVFLSCLAMLIRQGMVVLSLPRKSAD